MGGSASATRRVAPKVALAIVLTGGLVAANLVGPARASDLANQAIHRDFGISGSYDAKTGELSVTWVNPDPACLLQNNVYGNPVGAVRVGFEMWKPEHMANQEHLYGKYVKSDVAEVPLSFGESSWSDVVDDEGKPAFLVQISTLVKDDWNSATSQPGPCIAEYHWAGHPASWTHTVASFPLVIPIVPAPPTKDVIDAIDDAGSKQAEKAIGLLRGEVARGIRIYNAIVTGYGQLESTSDCEALHTAATELLLDLADVARDLKKLDKATPAGKKWSKSQWNQLVALSEKAVDIEAAMHDNARDLQDCDWTVEGVPRPAA